MSHASTILLYSDILDNQAIINHYLSVIDNVLKRLQTLKINIMKSIIVNNKYNNDLVHRKFCNTGVLCQI